MVKLVSAGHGGIDLEGRLEGIPESKSTIELNPYILAECGERYYLGKIALTGKDKEVNCKARLVLDESKKDFSEFHAFDDKSSLDDYLTQTGITEKDVTRVATEVALGQGALNAAFGMAVFGRSFSKTPIDVYLATIFESKAVKKKLPKEFKSNGRYKGAGDGQIITNVNIKGFSHRLTLRAPAEEYDDFDNRNSVLENLTKKDGILIDSVKDKGYAARLYRTVKAAKPHAYISATDSMLKSLGTDRVKKLLGECEVYIAQIKEMENLLNYKGEITRNNPGELMDAMMKVRSMMKDKGENARVYVTDNERGSYVLDSKDKLYYHPIISGTPVVNTNGCGDGFAAVATYLQLLRTVTRQEYSSADILFYASMAGQLKAGLPTACGEGMATLQGIDDFCNAYPQSRSVTKLTPKYQRAKKVGGKYQEIRALRPS